MSDATYHDASTGRFVSPEDAQDRPDETVRITHKGPAEPYAPTNVEVEAAAESIFKLRHPTFQYMGDEWARAYARAALKAAGEARARA